MLPLVENMISSFSAVSNHLAKTASKSVQPFGWIFVHKNTDRQTDRQTDKPK